jgi:SAM-dependent methyltransferase
VPRTPQSRRVSAPAAVIIALSAFLLFSVEPLVGKLALPVFGGTPGVWATCLFFFQAVLLAGYGYAHLSAKHLGPRSGPIVHMVVAVVAAGALWLTSGLRYGDLLVTGLPDMFAVLLILFATVGASTFVLTATTPLLSSWVVAVGRGGPAYDPYRLYALSNAGSFCALAAYPLLIEPHLGLAVQRAMFTVLFGVLVLGIISVGVVVVRQAGSIADGSVRIRAAQPLGDASVTTRRRLRWMLWAAVPAGLLSAITNFIATDLISAPLLWVGPLAIYLLTFVVAFSGAGRRVVPLALRLAPVAATLLWVPLGSAGGWPIGLLIVLEFAAFAVVAVALHGRLAIDRPAPSALTGFYLVTALGGVLASAFVALLAPLVFPDVWEYPILVGAAFVALAVGAPVTSIARTRRRPNFAPLLAGARSRLAPYLVVAIAVALVIGPGSDAMAVIGRWLSVGGLVLLVGGPPRFRAVMSVLVLVLVTVVLPRPSILLERSFFGVTSVTRPAPGDTTYIYNGTTLHGFQVSGQASRLPVSYYARSGPLGDVFALLDARTKVQGRAIGVIGLGSGVMSTYALPGETMTFYEIDPLVARVASDPAYFTYLSDSPIRPTITIGDARLSIEHLGVPTYDLLVLDAFSSDAVPAHLLTVEALAADVRVLRPGGILAFHLSNRYYDLPPAVAAGLARLGIDARLRTFIPTQDQATDEHAAISVWLMASTDPSALAALPPSWQPVDHHAIAPLTDDYTDILRLLRANLLF